jgi:hypothetical protein
MIYTTLLPQRQSAQGRLPVGFSSLSREKQGGSGGIQPFFCDTFLSRFMYLRLHRIPVCCLLLLLSYLCVVFCYYSLITQFKQIETDSEKLSQFHIFTAISL